MMDYKFKFSQRGKKELMKVKGKIDKKLVAAFYYSQKSEKRDFNIEIHAEEIYYRNSLERQFYYRNTLERLFYYGNVLEKIFFTIELHHKDDFVINML